MFVCIKCFLLTITVLEVNLKFSWKNINENRVLFYRELFIFLFEMIEY